MRFYNPDQKGDVLDQAHQAGHAATDPRKSAPLDAANLEKGKRAPNEFLGNKEGVERIRAQGQGQGGQGGKRPEDLSPQELHSVLWQVLSFRDSGTYIILATASAAARLSSARSPAPLRASATLLS